MVSLVVLLLLWVVVSSLFYVLVMVVMALVAISGHVVLLFIVFMLFEVTMICNGFMMTIELLIQSVTVVVVRLFLILFRH